mgnify:CR=1 FL=1
MKKIMLVFGTRPEAIKMAPLVKAIEADQELECVVAVSAQHREMLDQVLDLFEIKPQYDLNIMKANQTLSDITSGVLKGIEKAVLREKPDMVLVHGDTSTTFAGALAAFYAQVPVGHVEAGLRSGDLYSPFPEELNRKLTGVIAAADFAPTATAKANLLKEGTDEEKIFVTGNTVIDALLSIVDEKYALDAELENFLAQHKQNILITAHRRENQGQPMVHIFQALRRLHEALPEAGIIFPVHKNPKVRALAHEALDGLERVLMIEPLDYAPFANLMNRVDLIMTDSGGLQEEAPALGKPVLVLRENTERPEAVAAGTVKLVGTDNEKIFTTAYELLTDKEAYDKMQRAVNPYGDGHACERIIQAIKYYFGMAEKPEEWVN